MSPKYTVVGIIDPAGILTIAAVVQGDIRRSITGEHDPGQFIMPVRAHNAHAARLQAEHVVDQVLHGGDETGYDVKHRYPSGDLAPEMYA